MALTLHSMVGRLGSIVAPTIDLSGRLVESFLHLVQGPFSSPQGKKTIPPRLLLSLYTVRETAPLNPLGHPRQGKVITSPGQAGKVIGTPPGTSLHSLPRRPAQPPRKATYLNTPTRPNQGSSNEEPNPKWVINLFQQTLDTSSKVCSG